MPITIPSAALGQMTAEQRNRLLEAAFSSGPEVVANYLLVLDARLRVFERRYELPTVYLADAMAHGDLRDTADVTDWLFWADVRRRLMLAPSAPLA
jgi:hypothetical protein